MYSDTLSAMLYPLLLFISLSSGAVFEIDVGEQGMRFTPERVDNVGTGDTLIFHLYPQHDVVQSDFDSPCTPSEGGFYSGPFSETDNGSKRFVVNVTEDGPLYWYCSVDRHCQSGMVGGANVPTQGNTIDEYKNAARSVPQAGTPSQISGGQLVEEEDLASLTATSGSSTATASASSSQASTGATTTTTDASATSASGTGTAQATSPTGAADSVTPLGQGSTGALGVLLAIAGWVM